MLRRTFEVTCRYVVCRAERKKTENVFLEVLPLFHFGFLYNIEE